MKRRNFLRLSGAFSAAPFLLNGMPVTTSMTKSMLSMLECVAFNDRILILIEMCGGNDGLNTLVPMNQYDQYANYRPTIKLPDSGPNAVNILNPNDPVEKQVGLHPAMVGMKELYEQNKVAIIQNVSYPQYNLSHFKSTDLMLSGGDGTPPNYNIQTGWMGRYLDTAYPGLAGNPTTDMPDPLGIQVGNPKPSLGFHTMEQHQPSISLGYNNPEGYYNLVNSIGAEAFNDAPAGEYADELDFIMNVENSVELYAERISNVFGIGSNVGTYPDSGLGYQLKTVARLISGGSQTKVFLSSTGGFDTHEQQNEEGNTTSGWHPSILGDISSSIKAFMDDLQAQGLDNKVMIATFSEFGRQPIENITRGTDHGHIAPMFVIGNAVNQGVKGPNPILDDLVWDQLQTNATDYDYREIFTSLVKDWFGASSPVIQNTFSGNYDNGLNLIEIDPNQGPDCFVDAGLPVVISSFEVEKYDEKSVKLKWKVESELNFSHYEIEKSTDRTDFYKIDEVPAKVYQQGLKLYEYIDQEPSLGINYYRLKMVDVDGSFKLTPIKAISFEAESLKNISVYPNPATYDVRIAITAKSNFSAELTIFNLSGEAVKQQNVLAKKGFNKFIMPLDDVVAGQYLITLASLEAGIYFTEKLLVVNN